MATRLASSPSLFTTRPERGFKDAVFGPVNVEPRDIEIVAATGKTTETLTAALDAAAKMQGRFDQIRSADDSEKARPTFTPEDR